MEHRFIIFDTTLRDGEQRARVGDAVQVGACGLPRTDAQREFTVRLARARRVVHRRSADPSFLVASVSPCPGALHRWRSPVAGEQPLPRVGGV